MEKTRKTGVLLHITSLPSDYGVGDLGEEAYSFIDSLSESLISLWQILPTGPTGFGDSPYSSSSAFAGNELFISPKKLYLDGYLSIEDVRVNAPCTERINYEVAKKIKMPLIKKAAISFLDSASKEEKKEFSEFKEENSWWLDDYALFRVLSSVYSDSRWYLSWPEGLKKRNKEDLDKAKTKYKKEIEEYKVYQYFFFKEWKEMKRYANSKGVDIVGDIPIFVSSDSVDAWSHPELLMIDQNSEQEASSGVPPDAFSETGQLWGNPLYRWSEHEKTNYSWWIQRIKMCLELSNYIRIDHFRAFEAFWCVPKGEKNAINGRWIKGPGQNFFDAIKEEFGPSLPIIAEDLGVITKEVEKLRDDNLLAGMKILQFAFAFNDDGSFETTNAYLPQNYPSLSVAYTGTHDNNTTLGWYKTLDERTKDYIRRYFECPDDRVLWEMIRSLIASHAMWAILPMQDILGLDEKGRMNTPSTTGEANWSWKMKKENLSPSTFSGIKYYTSLYGRAIKEK